MRKKQLVLLSFLAIGSFFCGSCEKDIKTPGVFEPLYLDFSVSDTLGNQYTGDSIIIPSTANMMVFKITTNCSWSAKCQNKAGLSGWMSIPSSPRGGGDATITSTVSTNKTKNDRQVYYSVIAGDSAIVKTVVIVQPHVVAN